MRRVIVSITISGLSAFAVHLGLQAASASQTQTPAPQPGDEATRLAGVLGACPAPPYQLPPADDKIRKLITDRRQYQLVIGASDFAQSADLNRPFVHETARIVSARLMEMGYAPLPSLAARKQQFLSGGDATKVNVWNAIVEMAGVTNGSDVGLIYYIGHGSIAFSKRDLTLAVHDRPVARDEGIRVSDIISTLSLQQYPSRVSEVPKFILILETCYSGNVIGGTNTEVGSKGGMKILAEVSNGIAPQPPAQMVMVSATAEGDSTRAFDLKGSPMSAFGFFFTRAFKEDWACVDTTPDGILTVRELEGYLQNRLDRAHVASLVEGPMKPLIRDEQRFSFLAYDEQEYAISGDRDRVVQLFIRSAPGQIATITLPDGSVQTCPPLCTVVLSASSQGGLTIRSRDTVNFGTQKSGVFDPFGINISDAMETAEKSERVMNIPLGVLISKQGDVLRVDEKLSIQVR